VSALGHYLEEEGIATVAIALIRPQAENTKPPRALWLPFELSRPFGPPNELAFQKRVILSALRLLELEIGPVNKTSASSRDASDSAELAATVAAVSGGRQAGSGCARGSSSAKSSMIVAECL
jgi:hypothetical protein